MRVWIISGIFALSSLPILAEHGGSIQRWSLSRAVKILNHSPWARQETFTRVIGGVGSGVSGEKEIYNTFYVRFLSARPVRQAYTRIEQIRFGYDRMGPEQQEQFDTAARPTMELDVSRWIVVALGFRSNDPNEESRVREFFESQTTLTLRNRAFLSTERLAQVPLAAFFAPLEESVGAKFVFPRFVDEVPLVTPQDRRLTFELLDVPGAWKNSSSSRSSEDGNGQGNSLRAIFSVRDMVVRGEIVL